MSTTGRTYWLAKDSGWWRRELIVELGEEFGADGPAVIDWLSCEAKAQNQGGWVKAGYKTVARGCFVEVVTVGHVVSRGVTLGLLDDFEGDERRFTCRISGWRADQEKAGAAKRQAEWRERNSRNTEDSEAEVTVSNGESRSVTACPPTGQDRTEENSPPSPPKSGGRKRDRESQEEKVARYALEVFGLDDEDGVACVKWALNAGAKTSSDVRAYVRKWRPDMLREAS